MFVPPARTTSNLETEAARQKIIPAGNNDIVKKSSKVAFRASLDVSPHSNNNNDNAGAEPQKQQSNKHADARAAVETKPSSGYSATSSSPFGSSGQEKSLFRTLLGKSKLSKEGGQGRVRSSPERRKTCQGFTRSVSTVMSDHTARVVDNSDGDSGHDQTRKMSKSMELRKMRTKRSKDREDGRLRPFSAWFSSIRQGGGHEQSTGAAPKSNRLKMTPQPRPNERRAPVAATRSAAGAAKLDRACCNSQRRGDRDDGAGLNFADVELYDSEEDEEGGGDDGRAVPSLAKDDFVAYQTSQKKKVQKVRVSLMRL